MGPAPPFAPRGFDLDPERGLLSCRYALGGRISPRRSRPARAGAGRPRGGAGGPAGLPAGRGLVLQDGRTARHRPGRVAGSPRPSGASSAASTSTGSASSPTATASTCPRCEIDGPARGAPGRAPRRRRRPAACSSPSAAASTRSSPSRWCAGRAPTPRCSSCPTAGDRFAAIEGRPRSRACRSSGPSATRSAGAAVAPSSASSTVTCR